MVDAVLGLPDAVRGCLFDLDGVLTQTATVHAAAWKEMFGNVNLKWPQGDGANWLHPRGGASGC